MNLLLIFFLWNWIQASGSWPLMGETRKTT